MNSLLSRLVLIVADVFTLLLSILIAFKLRMIGETFFYLSPPDDLFLYVQYVLLYGVMVIVFCSQRIYRSRFDFWQESYRVIKGVFFSIILILSFLAMTKQSDEYSRFILVVSFALASFLIPFQKFWVKRFLYRLGWWKKEAQLIGEDPFFEQHVFNNPHVGYVPSTHEQAKTLFIASSYSYETIETILHEALLRQQSVIFIPAVKNFDFSDAHIIHLFNARANLIIVENNLLKSTNRIMKEVLDYCLALIILPFLVVLIGIIAWKIKQEDGGTIFFKQIRLGQNGSEFGCYKFRSMKENSNGLLQTYLTEHPEEVDYFKIYQKYENDPRITKMGHFLRKTSLDELPQIINVIKGEMSLVGPRPIIEEEIVRYGEFYNLFTAVKPGITGLWQVSGRSDVDYPSRVEMDVWYVRNWSIWNDMVILIKTVQVVFLRKGAS